jgi:hypothetical protein
MTLRNQITPLLDDYKRANGKGSMANANMAMIKIIETFLSHIEQQVPNGVSGDYKSLSPSGWKLTKPSPDLGTTSPGTAKEPGDASLLDAVDKLHDANYIVGADYAAIVDDLEAKMPVSGNGSDVVSLSKMIAPTYDERKPEQAKRGPGRPRKVR